MSEISDLKQRVEAVGQKFGRLAEQETSYGQRLTGLLNAVEEGFARSQKETQALKTELQAAQSEMERLAAELEAANDRAHQRDLELKAAKDEILQRDLELSAAKEEARQRGHDLDSVLDESKQLRGMLLALLEAVETGGNLDLGETMRNLETRIDRIVSTTDADLHRPPPIAPEEPFLATPQPADPPPGRNGAPLPAAAASKPSEPAPAEPVATETESTETEVAETEASETATESPAAGAAAPDTAGTNDSEPAVLAQELESPAESGAELSGAEHSGEPPAEVAPEAAEAPEQAQSDAPAQSGAGAEDRVAEEILARVAELEETAAAAEAAARALEPSDNPTGGGPRSDDRASGGPATEPPSDDDLSAVNKIIQRISLLTGEFVEPSQKPSEKAAGSAGLSLKVGNGADDRGSSPSGNAPPPKSP